MMRVQWTLKNYDESTRNGFKYFMTVNRNEVL